MSTPISKPTKLKTTSKNSASSLLFQQNALSPIKSHSKDTMSSSTSSNKSISPLDSNKYGTYRLSSSSTSSLNKMASGYSDGSNSPRRYSAVKRESSAPEIVDLDPSTNRNPFINKNIYNPNQRTSSNRARYDGSYILCYLKKKSLLEALLIIFLDVYSGRKSVGSSPSKNVSSLRQPSPNNTLYKLKQNSQLSGSTNELRPKQSGLPASKLRQYSSHKELNKIPGNFGNSSYVSSFIKI